MIALILLAVIIWIHSDLWRLEKRVDELEAWTRNDLDKHLEE